MRDGFRDTPLEKLTTGRPEACASAKTIPNPSAFLFLAMTLGTQNSATVCIQFITVAGDYSPRKRYVAASAYSLFERGACRDRPQRCSTPPLGKYAGQRSSHQSGTRIPSFPLSALRTKPAASAILPGEAATDECRPA